MKHHSLSSNAARSYWLGRYLERAESTARLVSVTGDLFLDMPRRQPTDWRPLVDITGNAQLFDELYDTTNEKNVTRFLINDQRNSGSLLGSLESARGNGRTLRGIIPRTALEYINDLSLFANENLSEPLSRSRRGQGLAEVPKMVQRIEGFMSANMLHDAHWRFFRIGAFIERADMTSRVVEVGVDHLFETVVDLEPFADIQWRAVLRSLNAVQSYNTVMQEPVHQGAVVSFTLKNEELPRAFLYALNSLRTSLKHLPRHERVVREVNRLRRQIRQADADSLDGAELHEFIDDCQIQLGNVHEAINRTYFESSPARRAQADQPKRAR